MSNNHVDETVRRMLANAKPMPVQGQPVQLAAANATHQGVLIPLQGQAANLNEPDCRAWWRAYIAALCLSNCLHSAQWCVAAADELIAELTKEAKPNGTVS